MLKKYVVELDEENVTSAMGYDWLRMPISVEGKEVDIETTIQLLPYIAPNIDIEKVKREAYREGREDGVHDGMCDAWEAAKKIALMDTETSENVTGYFGLFRIMENLTPMQAIEKLKAYEQEQEGLHVGDEFENETGKKFVVLKVNGKEIDCYIDSDGRTYHMNVKYRVMRKTGRHFPEITTFFEKMREWQE